MGRWLLPAALLVAACSPALNWRQAPLGGLRFALPCKPDPAAREVTLAGRSVPLDMQGCEAAGALFAISRAQVGDATAVPAVLQAWRSAALAALQADAPSVQAQLAWLVLGSDIYHLAVYADRLGADMTEPFFTDIASP